MAIDRKKQYEYDAKWKKENTVLVALRLTRKKDMDIIDALEGEGSMQSKLRHYLRLGIAYEKMMKEGQPIPQEKPMPLRPVEKKKAMIDLRKVVRGTVDNPGSVPDPE